MAVEDQPLCDEESELPSDAAGRSTHRTSDAIAADEESQGVLGQGAAHRRPPSRQCAGWRSAVAGSVSGAMVLASVALLLRSRATAPRLRDQHIVTLQDATAAVAPPSLSLCERCPVGLCERDQATSECLWTPMYRCQVDDCDMVPLGDGFSACWHLAGRSYYSLSRQDSPCHGVDWDAAMDAYQAALKAAQAQAKLQREQELELEKAKEAEAKLRKEAEAKRERERERAKEAHLREEAEAKHEKAAADAPPPFVKSSFGDTRLAAYWDVDQCGPEGDDFHSDWCGGTVREPTCQELVAVDAAVCSSGQAFLASMAADGATQFPDCKFNYYAQYDCMPETTSTTREPPTTTARAELEMLQDMERLEGTIAHSLDPAASAGFDATCASTFEPPAVPPATATELNGVWLPDVCLSTAGPHYVQVIGDWGGLIGKDGPVPANQRAARDFVEGVDDRAQLLVAEQMAKRAASRTPDYILNVGDSFYWAGLDVHCGTPANEVVSTGQFEQVFEQVYTGAGLEGKPWLGVLGNHDYGGHRFDSGWDQIISYTWGPGGRWIMPAQYWRQIVRYPGFAVDYFFVDTNFFAAQAPNVDPDHNICSDAHIKKAASCNATGPKSASDCPLWFGRLWGQQQRWLEKGLNESTANWQIVVTHFPPIWGPDYWLPMSDQYGIDLFISGHQHKLELHYEDEANYLAPTAWIVAGGGGGITSESAPDPEGHDDQYGFFELTLTKTVIEVQGISHGGQRRSLAFVRPRPRAAPAAGLWEELGHADGRRLRV